MIFLHASGSQFIIESLPLFCDEAGEVREQPEDDDVSASMARKSRLPLLIILYELLISLLGNSLLMEISYYHLNG